MKFLLNEQNDLFVNKGIILASSTSSRLCTINQSDEQTPLHNRLFPTPTLSSTSIQKFI
jgi:hypothetical protein